jgi:hypothetical protein
MNTLSSSSSSFSTCGDIRVSGYGYYIHLCRYDDDDDNDDNNDDDDDDNDILGV